MGTAPGLRAAVVFFALATGCDGAATAPFADLTDPAACKSCHPDHYDEWAGSMHAYAAEDPVFLAMNRRAQRDNPATGTFCVQCHAPVAVRERLTTDGLNLEELPREKRGVTCYFCHSAEKVDGTHNNPLVLAKDGTLFGPFSDPAPGMPHKGKYAPLFDDGAAQSAAACGSCHDIQNLQGAHVERTFEEWQGTLFASMPAGQSCAGCHMPGRDGPASTVSPTKVRRLHNHAFPAVDLALTPFPAESPQNDEQRAAAQALLDTVVQGTLCLDPAAGRIALTLDNVSAGHSWPSGATPDRRAWIELTAYAGEQVLYTSGGPAALPLEGSADPDLWLLRDCLFDGAGAEQTMFWQAARVAGNAIPGAIIPDVKDPTSFSRTHVKQQYPGGPALAQAPTRITARVHLQAIGDDVLRELVDAGDLDPSVPAQIARYQLGGGAVLDWTPTTASPVVDPASGATLSCVSTGTYRATTVPATSHAACAAE
jgi:hypothetical protein